MIKRAVRVPCTNSRLAAVISAAESYGARIIDSWTDPITATLHVDISHVPKGERDAYLEALTRICEKAGKI